VQSPRSRDKLRVSMASERGRVFSASERSQRGGSTRSIRTAWRAISKLSTLAKAAMAGRSTKAWWQAEVRELAHRARLAQAAPASSHLLVGRELCNSRVARATRRGGTESGTPSERKGRGAARISSWRWYPTSSEHFEPELLAALIPTCSQRLHRLPHRTSSCTERAYETRVCYARSTP